MKTAILSMLFLLSACTVYEPATVRPVYVAPVAQPVLVQPPVIFVESPVVMRYRYWR
jgi:hypothetical protein